MDLDVLVFSRILRFLAEGCLNALLAVKQTLHKWICSLVVFLLRTFQKKKVGTP